MTWDSKVPIVERNYNPNPESEMGRRVWSGQLKWEGAEPPQVGDLVTLVAVFGYERSCCGKSIDDLRADLVKPYIGQMVEIGIVANPRLPGHCIHCEYCHDHHHIVDNIFRYGIVFPGTSEGLMVGLHEITPTYQGWDLEGIDLDPTS